jgi:hypothetical protein
MVYGTLEYYFNRKGANYEITKFCEKSMRSPCISLKNSLVTLIYKIVNRGVFLCVHLHMQRLWQGYETYFGLANINPVFHYELCNFRFSQPRLKGNVSCDAVLCSSISTIILQKSARSIFSTEEFYPEIGGSMFLGNSGIHLHDNTTQKTVMFRMRLFWAPHIQYKFFFT